MVGFTKHVELVESAGDVRRVQAVGKRRFGLLRLVLNYLRAVGLVTAKEARGHLSEVKAWVEKFRRAPALSASLVELSRMGRNVVTLAVDTIVGLLETRFTAEGLGAFPKVEVKTTVMRFFSNRQALTRLLDCLGGSEVHGVVYCRRKGKMRGVEVDSVLECLRGLARREDLAYMLDVGPGGVHFHFLCAREVAKKVEERVNRLELGLQASVTPKVVREYWQEVAPSRDVHTYLALKLTPALQGDGISRRVRREVGTVFHDSREFGRVTCHLSRHRSSSELGASSRRSRAA
jgi:hypothetical protein